MNADGTRATVTVRAYANGAYRLQVFGSASQPLLQVVPTLSSVDVQGGTVYLYGSGYAEGASTYNFPGAVVTDDNVNGTIDVYNHNDQNQRAQLNSDTLRYFGLGGVSVSTAGGTSAPLVHNVLRPGNATGTFGALADVAVDQATGALWTIDVANPDRLMRLDRGTGEVLQTITLDAATYGNQHSGGYAGLQVLPQAMTLAGWQCLRAACCSTAGTTTTHRRACWR